VAAAYGQVVAAAVAVIASLSGQVASLEAALASAFGPIGMQRSCAANLAWGWCWPPGS
jgi:hypothetical protein